jgi:hypothetical protein
MPKQGGFQPRTERAEDLTSAIHVKGRKIPPAGHDHQKSPETELAALWPDAADWLL